MFDDWDIVHRRLWKPMAAFEQSMLRMFTIPEMVTDDEEFFRDLHVPKTNQSLNTNDNQESCNDSKQSTKDGTGTTTTDEKKHNPYTFSSYSFSNSTIVDDKGQQITSTRRRYEDSSGRLKAVHERQVEGKKLRTMWHRQSKEDDGRVESLCSSGTPEEFETMWQKSPFGKKGAEEQKQLEVDKRDNTPPKSKL